MKIITLHADYITYEAVKPAIQNPEKVEKKPVTVKECLVVLAAAEKRDESDIKGSASKLCEEVTKVAEQLNVKTVVLYPYAHLSSDLAGPVKALEILQESATALGKHFTLYRAPFGWYKHFEISCKGHPLAELSREFGPEKKQEESAALQAEKIKKSKHYVLDVDGKLHDADMFDFSKYPSLKMFYGYETHGTRAMKNELPHIRLMKKLELVDHEPGSDPGNFSWAPKGVLIKRLMENYVTSLTASHGGMEVETPIMYDYNHPNLSKYLQRFPARQYKILSDNKQYFLRFAACFGQYLIMNRMQISYKNLPLRLYELTHFSFRREQRGELAGLKRLRAFTMPDMHTLCRDIQQAKKEFIEQYKLSIQYMAALGLDYDLACRFVKSFYEEHEEFAKELVKVAGKPMLLELFDERYFYFVMKFEFSVNDALEKAATLSTVQIDVENAERFDITYTDEEGKMKHPYILHASISGSIDRDVYALLESEAMKAQKGKKPSLPLWLSPTQVRILPVSVENHFDYAKKLADEIGKQEIRVDIDDTEHTIGKKIRNAETEWVPYIIVVGDEELKSSVLQIRVRETGEIKKMKAADVVHEIKKKTEGLPFRKLPLSRNLSQRPVFIS